MESSGVRTAQHFIAAVEGSVCFHVAGLDLFSDIDDVYGIDDSEAVDDDDTDVVVPEGSN